MVERRHKLTKRYTVISAPSPSGPVYRIYDRLNECSIEGGFDTDSDCRPFLRIVGLVDREGAMKEICKNCDKCKPTYKGGICQKTGKKTKLSGTCEDWRAKQ